VGVPAEVLAVLERDVGGDDAVVVGAEFGVGDERADVLRIAEIAHRAANAVHLVRVGAH
jgi:hypothetical protein